MAGYSVFLLLSQTTLAYFLATLLIGILCEIFARVMKRAATLFVTSAIVPLVPGVGLYNTMRYVVEGNYSQAVNVGAATILGICGISLAITMAAVLTPIRFLSKKNSGILTSAPPEKHISCRLVRLNRTFDLILDKSFGTGTYAKMHPP